MQRDTGYSVIWVTDQGYTVLPPSWWSGICKDFDEVRMDLRGQKKEEKKKSTLPGKDDPIIC